MMGEGKREKPRVSQFDWRVMVLFGDQLKAKVLLFFVLKLNDRYFTINWR